MVFFNIQQIFRESFSHYTEVHRGEYTACVQFKKIS